MVKAYVSDVAAVRGGERYEMGAFQPVQGGALGAKLCAKAEREATRILADVEAEDGNGSWAGQQPVAHGRRALHLAAYGHYEWERVLAEAINAMLPELDALEESSRIAACECGALYGCDDCAPECVTMIRAN